MLDLTAVVGLAQALGMEGRLRVSFSDGEAWVARLAAPPVPADVPLARGVVLITLALSMLFPMLGLTLLAVLVVDMVLLSAVPPLKRLVG